MHDYMVYDKERIPIGLLQSYNSVLWEERYQEAGEVKITTQYSKENYEMLAKGNRIYRSDGNTVAVIEEREIEQTDEGVVLVVRAFPTAWCLNERVVMKTEKITNAEQGMYNLYTNNKRGWPIETAEPKGLTDTIEKQITWGGALDGIVKVAEESGLGFTVDFDELSKKETLRVYKGTDRTDYTSEDYIGYLSIEDEIIYNVHILDSTVEYKNVAIVAGEGEGEARTVEIVTIGNPTGEDRREMYVDAREVRSETDGGSKLSDAAYRKLLQKKGMESLLEQIKEFTVDCETLQNNIRFGVDYFLGDILPIKLEPYGTEGKARIESVIFADEESGELISIAIKILELEVEGK